MAGSVVPLSERNRIISSAFSWVMEMSKISWALSLYETDGDDCEDEWLSDKISDGVDIMTEILLILKPEAT